VGSIAEKLPDGGAHTFHLRLCGVDIKWKRDYLLLSFFALGKVTLFVSEETKRFLQMDREREIHTGINPISGEVGAELVTLF
jgi:hypothetical protein